MGDCALIHDAVGGEGFGRGGRVDGQGNGRRIRKGARNSADLELGGACHFGLGVETHFDTIIGRDSHPLPSAFRQRNIGRFEGDINGQWLVGLVLEQDRELKFVAKVQEAGRRRAYHQRQASRQAALGFAELLTTRIHSDDHHTVAGQVVGDVDLYGRFAVGIRADLGFEGGERVEVAAHSDGRWG